MAEERRGVAYEFWREVERRRVEKGWTHTELGKRAGLNRTTHPALRESKRSPTSRIVHALADAVGLERDKAEELAGLVPPKMDTDVRTAILQSKVYTEQQRRILLAMVDEFEQASGIHPGTASPGTESAAQ